MTRPRFSVVRRYHDDVPFWVITRTGTGVDHGWLWTVCDWPEAVRLAHLLHAGSQGCTWWVEPGSPPSAVTAEARRHVLTSRPDRRPA